MLIHLLGFVFCISLAQSWSLNETVFISTGCEAYAYHKKMNCASLQECNAEGHVSKTTRFRAIKDMRRTPCGRCLRKEYDFWKGKGWLVRKNNKTIRKAQPQIVVNGYEKH